MSAAADVPDLGGEDDVRQRSPEGDGRADRDGDGEAVGPGLRVVWAEGDDVVDGSRAGEDWVAGGLVAGEGDGEGVEVLEAGRAWHTVSVFAVVAIGAACASASRPRVRKLPLSKVTAATLTCAKRIRIACLRCSSGLPCALRDSEATRGSDGYGYSYPLRRYICITCIADHRACPGAPLPGAVFARVITDLTARLPDRFRDAHHGRGSVSVVFPSSSRRAR